jgi:histidine ammonia-lyase
VNEILINGETLTLDDLILCAYSESVGIRLDKRVREKIRESAKWLSDKAKDRTIYGVNTGFGSKENVRIPKGKEKEIQRNLIISHAGGTGKPLDIPTTRALMLLRINALAKGYSGIRLETLETLVEMLKKRVYPVIPEQGSVGASGDLAQLSHIALVLIGEGEAIYNSKRLSGREAMKRAGLESIKLTFKEGLALNNGSQFATSVCALAVHGVENLLKHSVIVASMSLEALLGFIDPFEREIIAQRPYPGIIEIADCVRNITQGSKFLGSDKSHVQDSYSLRCIPHVLGPCWDTIKWVHKIVDVEINSATDNPLIFTDIDRSISGCNFHGEPIALASDFLGIATCEIGSIAERRIFKLLSSHINKGLPSFLIKGDGTQSGFQIIQYTAASLVSENKILAHPASVDSIPTCEDQEDFVSMAPIAATKARKILENVEKIVTIELILGAQAIDLRFAQKSSGRYKRELSGLGKGTYAAYKSMREEIAFLDKDRPVYKDIEKGLELLKSGEILKRVEQEVGPILG